ncbi:MAG: phosphoribosylamine--glycine ligase [Alphaproteobacteria bacterium]|nr:phosphoribosylamine--glycine ligase [Alphaproteobacteria bacterium]
MKVLLIGSGGREHALAWALAQSRRCEALWCAPGNAGIASCADCVDIRAEDIPGLVKFAKEKAVDLVVVGPEGPLVAGLADELKAAGIKVFGPSKAAARLEGSKAFMKDFFAKYKIPTAAYGRFTDLEKAKEFIKKNGAPIVVKTDGLAAGKGVTIAQTEEEAIAAAKSMLSGEAFGAAGSEIVIEQFLDGEELSYFALADGKTILPLTSAQDHKRVGDGDTGPNTGGMGAYSPAHMMTPELERRIIKNLIEPTIAGMAKEGCPFTGVLFAGIMVVKGEPLLLEYNVRFGDPECQTLMLRFKGDLLDVLDACAEGKLETARDEVNWTDGYSLCVVMAANGYPGTYEKNSVIEGLQEAAQVDNVTVFHAGTARKGDEIIATGGRVLGVTATGENIGHAKRLAYEAVDKIDWPGGFCRRDIGWRGVAAAGPNPGRKTG